MKTRTILAAVAAMAFAHAVAETDADGKLAIWNAERARQGLPPISYATASVNDVGDDATAVHESMRRAAASSQPGPPVVSNVKMEKSGDNTSIGWYYITYDLDSPSRKKCNVSVALQDRSTGETIPASTFNNGDIGSDVDPGQGKRFYWNALADWPGHSSDQVYATVTATEMETSSEWTTVRIEWSSWGGKDLDICAYWADTPSQCVGYGWGNKFSDIDWESGDNTGTGPEYVRVSPEGSTGRRFVIHLNYFNTPGSPPKARIVVTGNGKRLDPVEVSANGSRTGSKAQTSDPGAVVVFGEFGEPISIESL